MDASKHPTYSIRSCNPLIYGRLDMVSHGLSYLRSRWGEVEGWVHFVGAGAQ